MKMAMLSELRAMDDEDVEVRGGPVFEQPRA